MSPQAAGIVPDGPSGYPILGHLPHFLSDRLGFLTDCANRYGDVVKLEILAPTFLLNDPHDIRHVLVVRSENYRKSWQLTGRRGRRLFGDALLTGSGKTHLRRRRLLNPVFHRGAVEVFADTMTSVVDQTINSWRSGDEVDIASAMRALAQTIVIQAIFGPGIGHQGEQLAAAIRAKRRFIDQVFTSVFPFPEYLPTRVNLDYRRTRRTVDRIIYTQIREHRRRRSMENSLIEKMAGARDDNGDGLTDRELYEHIVELLNTGYVTVAEALTWTLYLLSQHPEADACLSAELARHLDCRRICAGDVARLSYAQAFFAESLRLYPPTWMYVRIAVSNDVLPSGGAIPAGAKVYLCPYTAHRNPKYFPEPGRFDPGRFLPGLRHPGPQFCYFPFGGGVRNCIGEAFAKLEGVIVLASIAQRFRLETCPGQHVVPQPGITLRPKGSVQVKLLPR